MVRVLETEETRSAEEVVADQIQTRWGVKLQRMPRKYKLDYAAYEQADGSAFNGNKITGWWEIKSRTINHDRYPTYMISLAKVEAGLARAANTGIPAYLAVQFMDGTYVWKFAYTFEVSFGGRWVPRKNLGTHENDREPVALIPNNQFIKLC